ncbi:hypothetical protein F6X66_18120 [Dickeya solani]|nr:hypothetical protein [Dickeya solani]MZG59833.1 hypothetical protein [Dickeya solani]MZH12516.1 hypothetical protein [Dickeya solani]MZH48800.1 hypothetical protein [Dickeya solani]MZI98480.1 hypothetical protein [Dickeya solani]
MMSPDGFTLAGQRKRCSKTLAAFLSDATRAFAASMRLIRRRRPPQHSFSRQKKPAPCVNTSGKYACRPGN